MDNLINSLLTTFKYEIQFRLSRKNETSIRDIDSETLTLIEENNLKKILDTCIYICNEEKFGENIDVLYQMNPYFYYDIHSTMGQVEELYHNFMNYFHGAQESAYKRSIKKFRNYTNKTGWEQLIDFPLDKMYILVIENFNFWDLRSQYFISKVVNKDNIIVIGQVRTDFEFAKKISRSIKILMYHEESNKENKTKKSNEELKSLENIFDNKTIAPVFKPNPKYCTDKFLNLTPYISYNDVQNELFIIRARPRNEYNSFDAEEREIIVQYNSLKEIVDDGWQLD